MDLSIDVFEGVYQPSEDSFLLIKHLQKRKGSFLEIGTGTGIVSLSNARYNKKGVIVGVDINIKAIQNAKHNAKSNNITNVSFFVSDIFSKVKGKFDTICYNPPYLGKDEDTTRYDRNFIDEGQIESFIKNVKQYLTENGKAYLILSTNNKNFKNYLKMIGEYKIIEKEKYFFEELLLVEFKQ